MDIMDLEVFLTIIRTKSISSAANVLFLSSSAVGARLKSLEEELGFSLLVRKKGYKTIQLTDKGNAFIPYAEQWLHLWKESLRLREAGESKKFSFGCSSSLFHFSTDVCARFQQLYPNLQMDVCTLDSDIAYSLIQQNKLDLGLVMHPYHTSGVITRELFKENLVVSYAPVYHCEEKAAVSIHSFPLENQILFLWNNGFEEWYTQHIPYYSGSLLRVNSALLLTELFDANRSWAIVPLSVAKALYTNKHIPYRRILENPPERSAYLVYNHADKDQPLTKSFDSLLAAHAQEILSV